MGYTAVIEDAVQIRTIDGDTFYPRADVLVRDTQAVPRPTGAGTAAPAAVTVAEMLPETLTEEKPYRAIAIQRQGRGEPVAWLELLSPSNKGTGHAAVAYRVKREMLIKSGLVFIELDYLHETPPTFDRLLDYTDPETHEQGAMPYRIVILDPRPDVKTGPAVVHEFAVDDPLPVLDIPLLDDDDKTFTEMGYGLERVDYAELPAHFDRYSPRDRARIYNRLVAVLEVDVNVREHDAPLPVEKHPLDEARARYESLC